MSKGNQCPQRQVKYKILYTFAIFIAYQRLEWQLNNIYI